MQMSMLDKTYDELVSALSVETVHIFMNAGLEVERQDKLSKIDGLRVPRLRDFAELLWGRTADDGNAVKAILCCKDVQLLVKDDNGSVIYYQTV